MNKVQVNLIISIDTECDKGPGWEIPKPMGFRNITEGIPNTLKPLFDQFNIKPTYLLSPEVIKSQECVNIFKEQSNAELGTHLHGEFIGPAEDLNANRTSTPQLKYDPETEKAKLENLTNLFIDTYGYAPLSFRAGRWGMSPQTLHFLQDLGYRVDSSVCSFRTHYFDDDYVNFWGAPLQPYHPSMHDFRKKGKMKILEVPATLGNPHLMKWPRFILRNLDDKSRVHKKILGKLGYSSKISWFRPWKSSAEEMKILADQYIAHFANNGKPALLNMMFHSNEILQGTSPYAQTENELTAYIESIKKLFDHLQKTYDLEGIGLSDVSA